MAGWSNRSYKAAQTIPRYKKRKLKASDSSYEAGPPCKKRKLKATTNIESLPDDIIFDILVRVPAQDIFDSTRLVCRKWYKMIQTRNFVHSHLQRSTPGLLSLRKRTFITMQNSRIEISKLSYGFKGEFLSSCNGLLLERRSNIEEPYITNPVTKQHFALPPFPSGAVIFSNKFAIAYAASSGAYKVVHASHSNHNNLGCISIITVGVDTGWGRRVSTQHLSNTAKELLKEFQLTTQGFVHWAPNGLALKIYSDCLLTMNVESEIITQIPGPCLCLDCKVSRYCYLPMGSYLSLLIARSRSSWEAWKMKPETVEWTKMPSIDMKPMFKYLSFRLKPYVLELSVKPVGWSNSQDVLFFAVPNFAFRVFASYNVRTREIAFCKLDSVQDLFVDHSSSLVRLD